jgi:hypothetical protein
VARLCSARVGVLPVDVVLADGAAGPEWRGFSLSRSALDEHPSRYATAARDRPSSHVPPLTLLYAATSKEDAPHEIVYEI